ncbi:hypothetical protein [Tropicimonas aquimaris]|uniref:4 TMS phage holin, superfamily IV n=1 Tax=Tropicimonas aquimaris TaxID=914152 RepID=A0ABW3IUS7_9RHOB
MMRTLISVLFYILANGVGLLVAALLLDGLTLSFTGFLIATLLLSLVEAIAAPIITKLSDKNVPALKGGVALVTTFVGLGITNAIVSNMSMDGLATWLAATLLVWLGALIANILLPMFMFKNRLEASQQKPH